VTTSRSTAGQGDPPTQQRPTDKGPRFACRAVVGIGASAGGLEACKTFLDAVPGNTGIAFVLVLHLDPKHESPVAGLLGKRAAIPVVEALVHSVMSQKYQEHKTRSQTGPSCRTATLG
jgi:chemotaxis response regulator CheB